MKLVKYFIPAIPPGRYDTTNDSSEIICKIIPMIVKMVLFSPIEKYKVANNEPKYMAVKGRRSDVSKCFTNDENPHNMDKLANEKRLPSVKNILNFRAANKRTGM